MFKSVQKTVWAFDIEWVPDPDAARVLVDDVHPDASDRELMDSLWLRGGASEEDPRPYLKTVLCRIVSIAAVERRVRSDGSVGLNLVSLPHDLADPEQIRESNMISRFLDAIGERQPQLVGFNSMNADLTILIQRAIVNGIEARGFATRPDKPWEGVDYFARGSEFHIDLMDVVGPSWGRGSPSLHEITTLSGIPGKFEIGGAQVADKWLEGDLKSIVDYNECDAISTYLLWLRTAHFGGFFDDERYDEEQALVQLMLETLSQRPDKSHLKRYLKQWMPEEV
jgi:predicted PolB exonuclease-like 3'-5' exonuclease